MAFSLVTHAIGSASDTATPAATTTGSTLILVASVSAFATGLGTLSDSKSNTWTALTTWGAVGPYFVRMSYCLNPTVGTGHTFSTTGTSGNPGIAMIAFSGTVGAKA